MALKIQDLEALMQCMQICIYACHEHHTALSSQQWGSMHLLVLQVDTDHTATVASSLGNTIYLGWCLVQLKGPGSDDAIQGPSTTQGLQQVQERVATMPHE